MREIKFRAWVKPYDDSEGIMMYLPMHVLKFDYEDGHVLAFTDYPEFYNHEAYPDRKPHQFEVMQFTGLKDKNGKEIYEGDVLAHADGRLSSIEYDAPHFILRHHPEGGSDFPSERNVFVVIGNIYENPELIK